MRSGVHQRPPPLPPGHRKAIPGGGGRGVPGAAHARCLALLAHRCRLATERRYCRGDGAHAWRHGRAPRRRPPVTAMRCCGACQGTLPPSLLPPGKETPVAVSAAARSRRSACGARNGSARCRPPGKRRPSGCALLPAPPGGRRAALRRWICHPVSPGELPGRVPIQRVTESFRLEKTFRASESNRQPHSATSAGKSGPQAARLHVVQTPPGMVAQPLPWAACPSA